MSNENIVIVQDLEKKYKSGTHAVKGINFNVRKGEIFGMLGPNGAGKTTTLQMMGTLLGITEGKIKILDYDVSTESSLVRENIGFALQEAGLDSLSTVRELIAFHVKLFGFRGVEIQKRVEQSLSLLDLHKYSDQMSTRSREPGIHSTSNQKLVQLIRRQKEWPGIHGIAQP